MNSVWFSDWHVKCIKIAQIIQTQNDKYSTKTRQRGLDVYGREDNGAGKEERREELSGEGRVEQNRRTLVTE